MMIIDAILCTVALAFSTPHDYGLHVHSSRRLQCRPGRAQQAQTADAVTDAQQATATAANSESDEKEVDGVKLLAIEAHIVSYTNEERVRYGLQPFEVDKQLMDTARQHCNWMARSRSMVHSHGPVAENIAMGQPDSSDVVRAWMNSPGYRANILNPGHLRIGVAAYRTEEGTIFWCQQFQQ